MHKKLRLGVAIGALLLATVSIRQQTFADEFEGGGSDIRHVLLISVDGFHSLDFANCAKGISGFKGGTPYCPNLAALALHGVNYLNSSTSKPSDSFPGLMAIVAGGSGHRHRSEAALRRGNRWPGQRDRSEQARAGSGP